MMSNPALQILDAIRRGANPNQIAAQLAQNNPAIRYAMQVMNGKTPEQVRDMAYQIAQQRGLDLNQIARQLGITLPK